MCQRGRAIVMRLKAPKGRRMAVGAEENPRQDDLAVTAIDKPAGFGHSVVNWLTPEGGAKFRDDAVSTMGVAAVLDLEKSTLPSRLVIPQEREGR